MALAVSSTEVNQAYSSPSPEASLTAPTRSSGDGLIAEVWLESTSITPSTPTGWTLLGAVANGTSMKLWWFGRIADNTTTDNFKSTFTATGRISAMRRITGEPEAVSGWVVGTGNSGSGKEAKLKAATGPTEGSLALGLWMTMSAFSVASVTSGWTNSGELGPLISKTVGAATTGEPVVKFTATQTWTTLMVVVPPKAEAKAPENTEAPVASGTAKVGETLSTTTGAWTGSPTSYTYVWERSPNSNFAGGEAISGATGSTYKLAGADAGKYVRCAVWAHNEAGETGASSNKFGPVEAGTETIEGSAALSGAGSLSATASRLAIGKATLTGAGSAAAKGTSTRKAQASLAGVGGLGVVGTRIGIGKAALTGVGSLSAKGTPTTMGKAALSGLGHVAADGVRSRFGQAILSGIGALLAAGTAEHKGGSGQPRKPYGRRYKIHNPPE